MNTPRVTDNDDGEITVSINGRELRGYSYDTDAERRVKMLCAREYVEGWHDGGAPELLAAAQAAWAHRPDNWDSVWDQLGEAIAKAEGGAA